MSVSLVKILALRFENSVVTQKPRRPIWLHRLSPSVVQKSRVFRASDTDLMHVLKCWDQKSENQNKTKNYFNSPRWWMMMHDRVMRQWWLVWVRSRRVWWECKLWTVIRTYIQLNVIFKEGHFLTVLLVNALPLTGWCEEVSLTMPEPSCCSRPEPWEPPNTADGLRDRMLCILLLNRYGTLLLVLGIEPPCNVHAGVKRCNWATYRGNEGWGCLGVSGGVTIGLQQMVKEKLWLEFYRCYVWTWLQNIRKCAWNSIVYN